jgi:tRNA modification GTPase
VHLDDTIVAISTPPGRGGLGVVRLSGPQAREIAAPLLRLKHGLEPQRAAFGDLIEPEIQEKIDEVVVTYFAAPHSYTTEDVLEISAHGSPVVLRRIVEACLAGGARMAEPGEFTLRAFLNGRIDLTQAEAVRDLIDAQTLFQARTAARQLGGSLSHAVAPHKQKLVELIATLEAGVDFAEDDVSVLPWEDVRSRIDALSAPLRDLARSFAYGKLVREGLTLAIVGRPNVGKSSLFNRLVERERAIVTATPGTTRDLVTETVSLGGIPVHLVDTAGIRHALDEAESIGVRKSMEALAEADVVLLVIDSSQKLPQEDHELFGRVDERRTIVVANKSDLVGDGAECPGVRTSAITGEGIEELRQEIQRHVHAGSGGERESAMLTNVRQQQAVNAAISSLDAARKAAETNTPHEMLLLDLYAALRSLDELTGATTTDDILNLIFSTFCIGK